MNFIATSNATKIAHDNVVVAGNVVKKKRTFLNINQLGSSSVGMTGPDCPKPITTNNCSCFFANYLKSDDYTNSCLIIIACMRNLLLTMFRYRVAKIVAKTINSCHRRRIENYIFANSVKKCL